MSNFLPKHLARFLTLGMCLVVLFLGGEPSFAQKQDQSLGCTTGDSGIEPPFPFDIGDGNDYGQRKLELTVPDKCRCDGGNCTPCPIVVGYHGYGESGTSKHSWKRRLEPKGEAVGFISLYPTGDMTETNYFNWGALKKRRSRTRQNWAVPSCQAVDDGCLLVDGIPCDWCGSNSEDDEISTRREIDFTLAIIQWTMDHYCVDPEQIFATGFSNGGLMSYLLSRHPETSGVFKALVPVGGVDQAGRNDHLKWIHAPPEGNSPWILHANEIFDRFEPYDGRTYADHPGNAGGGWNSVWLYPSVLQVFAKYVTDNDGYLDCGFAPTDMGDRYGMPDVGGIVPEGYRRLFELEGSGQKMLRCFTKDAQGKVCRKLAICLWDGGAPGDDLGISESETRPDKPKITPGATHERAGREWMGGDEPGVGGTAPMDVMWRFFQSSVNP